jgi:hypothetical protein
MAKCKINENNEITNFWNDSHPQIPEDALDCDVVKPCKSYNDIWLYTLVDGVATPTEDGIAWETLAYSRKREAEYPSLQECVHAILDDTLDALQAKRAEIKTKFPKG